MSESDARVIRRILMVLLLLLLAQFMVLSIYRSRISKIKDGIINCVDKMDSTVGGFVENCAEDSNALEYYDTQDMYEEYERIRQELLDLTE